MSTTDHRILLGIDTSVTCPHCEHEFSLEQGFAKKALESLEAASRDALTASQESARADADKRAQALAAQQVKAAEQQVADLRKLLKEQGDANQKAIADVRAITEQAFKPQLDALRAQLLDSQAKLTQMDQREAALAAREQSIEQRVAAAAQAKAAELVAGERQAFEQRLADSQQQVAALRAQEIALRDAQQRLEDEKAAMALDVRRQVDEQAKQRESTVRAQEKERADLEKAELQKTIDDMSAKLAEAQRKADQGSQQMQGEVLELAIEEGLRRNFPIDAIEEVKKGQRGGDVIQRVMTRSGHVAGVVLWETKRAKDWSPQWIAKLKEDMRAAGAEVGVLVTMPTAVPKEWPAGQLFGLHEDVWVSTWGAALQVGEVLRAGILDVHKQRVVSAGKGEKMEAVYDYVTSPQFAQKLRAVYDMFTKMREELESEKNQATQRWARREKQLQSGVAALLGIGGDVQGLAQESLPALELQPAPAASDDT